MVDSAVRAMTWNIWWRFGPRWRDRQPGIRATLERFRPDVVALQEVWAGDGTTQADELADALQMHAVFASPSYPPAPTDPNAADWASIDLGIAVLSRWRILESGAPVDAWSAGQGAADAVTLPSTHPSAPLEAGPQMVDQRIDHIFFRPGREDQQVLVEGVQLAGEPVGGIHPSDHRAVIADLRWAFGLPPEDHYE
jgi:endonuclease/exonuclease/phosphatase family metal-dependent hydrolase